jgi:microcompartment protein CcmK/EutM
MSSLSLSRVGSTVGLVVLLSSASTARAEEARDYSFAEAAQEITQLFWLAETATACGWASAEDTAKFKYFTVRYLSAHLSGNYKMALVSMVTEDGYEASVRRVAQQSAYSNCDNSRWHTGWVAYKAAADQHDQEF